MNNKLYFPLFVDLTEKSILVVGAGRIARRRIMTLLDFSGKITVIAPDIHPDIESLAVENDNLEILVRKYESTDLDGKDMAIVATTDVSLNVEISRECKERGIPVNTSHDKSLCDFYFPGLVRKDNIVVGVTSCGTDHAAAKKVTDDLKRYFE